MTEVRDIFIAHKSLQICSNLMTILKLQVYIIVTKLQVIKSTAVKQVLSFFYLFFFFVLSFFLPQSKSSYDIIR